jgi:hypothetical protein
MAEVGVHVDEQIVIVLQSVAHAGQDGRAQAELAGAVQDVDARVGRRQLIRQRASAVGRIVINDQHVGGGHGGVDLPKQGRQVVALLVSGDGDQHTGF